MANLLGANIGQNYKGILNLNTLNGNLSGILQAVTDGDGNASPLRLSTTRVDVGAFALFGGTTNAFPALKRNGTGLELRSADDTTSGEPTFTTFNFQVTNLFYAANALNFGYSGGTTGLRIDTTGAMVSSNAVVSNAAASSQFEVRSTTKGFLPPRMTTAQRDAIASPAAGLVIYNTTTNVMNFFNGTVWGAF